MLSSFQRHFTITKKIISSSNTNMYLLNCGTKCLIIDPADDFDSIVKLISKNCPNSKPDIFLTHGHHNHIFSVPQLCDYYKQANIFASKQDVPLFLDFFINLSKQKHLSIISPNTYLNRMKFVKEDDTLKINDDIFDEV